MNIIALLELISLDKSKIGKFSRVEFTQIKKQLVAEKETNQEIRDSDTAKLLKALKSDPESFLAVLNNRILFNFFTKKDYPRTYFLNELDAIDTEKVKTFVQLFLSEELAAFFYQNLGADKFNEISHLAAAINYFPDSLNFVLSQHALDKLDNAIAILKPPYGNFYKVLYIKDGHFFSFLNHIKNQEIEQKIKDLLDSVTTIYNQDQNSELVSKTYLAMNNYTALDDDFSQKIKRNKDIAETKFEAYIPKKKNLTWVYLVVGFFVFIRIIVFFNSFNFDNYSNDDVTYDDETVYKPEPRKIDRYYANMHFIIDSFQVFLADFKPSEIRQMSQDIILKTGENPFQTFYQNEPAGESSNFIKVKNNTGYDMVLLENAVLYDTIKIPRTAHFIKAGDALEINFNRADAKTIFNMYLGKKWATFQTDSNHLFIRNHSIVEYRFSELIPTAKEILKTDYSLVNDAVISYSNGGLDIDSENARINPINEFKE
ncbi:hypothetical protein [Flavobacterium sangjuense]|uniref:Uncharacterized protein n=1 Tax=Flavobacterium sangjuense TaxID=2518177 RepID=A0A4P7PQV4_9FLAO|nr:hypothetical protein [Flavobacterium sangjuense]QBZ97169.1 hypothetical protein GS03_00655 [Flavobacterium sangjuense]